MKKVLLALLALAIILPAFPMLMPPPNLPSHNDKTLLQYFRNNDIEGVKNSIRQGADPERLIRPASKHYENRWGDAGGSLLINAILNENPEMACALIEAGANPNARFYHSDVLGFIYRPEEPALVLAAERNLNGICALLLEKGAEANAHWIDGETALQVAIKSNNHALIKLLISKGAKLQKKKNCCPSSCSIQ